MHSHKAFYSTSFDRVMMIIPVFLPVVCLPVFLINRQQTDLFFLLVLVFDTSAGVGDFFTTPFATNVCPVVLPLLLRISCSWILAFTAKFPKKDTHVAQSHTKKPHVVHSKAHGARISVAAFLGTWLVAQLNCVNLVGAAHGLF